MRCSRTTARVASTPTERPRSESRPGPCSAHFNAGRQWTFTKRHLTLDRSSWHTYGVEVTRRRISWFIDAHVVATLRNPRAISDVRLTPRLRLRAVPGAAMDRTRIGVDWVRHFTLKSPNRLPVRAPAPTVSAYRGC